MATEVDDEATSTSEGSRSGGFRVSTILAAAFGVLLLVLLVAVLATTGGEQKPAATPPGAAPHAPPAGGDEGSTEIPQSPPPGVRWQLYHTVALPVSDKAGPRQITDSTATGYAHTPTGALLAGAQIQYRQLLAPNWQQVSSQQVMPGPGRDAFTQARAQMPGSVEPAPGELAQLSGFRVLNYSPQMATIQYVSRTVSGAQTVTTSTLQWDGGDWKLKLPDGPSTAQPLTSNTGVVPWGGV